MSNTEYETSSSVESIWIAKFSKDVKFPPSLKKLHITDYSGIKSTLYCENIEILSVKRLDSFDRLEGWPNLNTLSIENKPKNITTLLNTIKKTILITTAFKSN